MPFRFRLRRNRNAGGLTLLEDTPLFPPSRSLLPLFTGFLLNKSFYLMSDYPWEGWSRRCWRG